MLQSLHLDAGKWSDTSTVCIVRQVCIAGPQGGSVFWWPQLCMCVCTCMCMSDCTVGHGCECMDGWSVYVHIATDTPVLGRFPDAKQHRALLHVPGGWILCLGGPSRCEWSRCPWLWLPWQLLLPLRSPRARAGFLVLLPA